MSLSASYFQQIKIFFKRIFICYLVYFFCRILFFAANKNYFEDVTVFEFIEDCLLGLRFDTFSIVVSNSLFIVLSLLPLKFFWHRSYQNVLLFFYIITNVVFVALNCIDAGYYAFTKKRATSEIFDQIGGQTDMGKLLPQFLKDFWWILLLFFVFIFLLIRTYKKIKVTQVAMGESTIKNHLINWSIFIILAALSVLGVRGGLQRVPIDVVNAGSMTRPDEIPIVLNTPFTIIKSASQKALPEYHFYSEKELTTIYNPVHQFKSDTINKMNVVVLILESFSKEYTRLGKTTSITPFLDSLMNKSLVFTNAFSNGTKSIEGIPAILSSLPSLMPNPFINSMYANNDQSSFAHLLNKEGYYSAFFHGGINGTMNFDDWAALAGYQNYYGKNEYGNDADFDGFWGIWDEPFLQFSVNKMNAFKQPFHSAIFTLSSHHPYFVPEKYKGKFKKTALENSECIGYADHSLRLFFESAKKSDWYQNTLFVLVADHSGISEHPFYSQVVGLTSIPILFFKPDNSLAGENNMVFSQIDILPSVLDVLGYNKKFFSFGDSYKEQQPRNDLMYANGTHFSFGDSTVYWYHGLALAQAFNYKRDSTLQHNIAGEFPLSDSLQFKMYKSFMQTYHRTVIYNTGRIKN